MYNLRAFDNSSINTVPGVMIFESETSDSSLGSTGFPAISNSILNFFSSASWITKNGHCKHHMHRRQLILRQHHLWVSSQLRKLTAISFSFEVRNRLDRCWFILALGATPSAWKMVNTTTQFSSYNITPFYLPCNSQPIFAAKRNYVMEYYGFLFNGVYVK